MNLSKSLYTKGIQCPKALWLKKYNTEALTTPDETAIDRFETGNEIGELACELFPNGVEVPYTKNFDEMIEYTSKYIEDGIKYIYEATFRFNGIIVMVDILAVSKDGISLYEVKSSTSVKDIYLHDAAIQYYVLQNLGYTIKTANIVHVNSSYVRNYTLDLDKFFTVANVTPDVIKMQVSIPSVLTEFTSVLSDKINEPNIDIGKHCHFPYECDAKEHCWHTQRQIPKYSIFNIFNLGSKKQCELYKKGITNIEDIPETFSMTHSQKMVVDNFKTQKTFIDNEKIKEFVDTLTYPIYHLDFETFQQSVPEFEGISPYQQIPFQYSLHIEHEDGTIEHREYLSQEGIDPRYELAKRLCEDIPTDVTVLVYNKSFEQSVIKKLASPYNARSLHLLSINENIKDLMVPFQQKHYLSPAMNGSYSIKYVLPALVPELAQAYKKLEKIQNGSQAMNAFAKMDEMEDEEKEKLRTSLLEYCKLDTLAMVKILEVLRGLSS